MTILMLESSLSHVKPTLSESLAEWDQFTLEKEKISEDYDRQILHRSIWKSKN